MQRQRHEEGLELRRDLGQDRAPAENNWHLQQLTAADSAISVCHVCVPITGKRGNDIR